MQAINNLRPIRRLGQNFLVDDRYVKRIVDSCEIKQTDLILEVGPGRGVLTKNLSLLCGHLTAVEKDKRFCALLKDKFVNIDIICSDILKYDIRAESEKSDKKFKVIGNLPYYITSPIITYLIDNRKYIDSAFLTVQKEVAERLVSPPGKKSYGSLSCLVQYYCDIKLLFKISKKAFWPQPKVESCLVKLEFPKTARVRVKNEELFFKIIRASFNKRRKTLLNALSELSELNYLDKPQLAEFLSSLGINPSRRGETLNLEEFAKISDKMEESVEK